MSATAQDAFQGSGNHSANYLDGAPATDAFQALIDRGLFSDKAPASPAAAPVAQPATQAATPPGEPARTPEPVSTPAATAADRQTSTEGASAQTAEAEEFKSLDEYLTKAGLDRNSFLELPVTVKVDGAESQVPLATLLRTYQTDAHVTQKSQALAQQQQQWQTEQAAARQALTQQLSTAKTLADLAHQQLLAEFQGVDWNTLRLQNPGEWAALNQQFQQRAGAIQQQLAQVNQIAQGQAAEAQRNQVQALAVEQSKMFEAFPEWRDPQKFQAARQELTSYAKQTGFSDAELSSILDHRYMKVLHDASRYAALQAKSPAVLKMVRAAPPMAGPGSRQTRNPQAERLQQIRAAGKAGKFVRNEDAQAAAFSALVDAGA